MLETERTLQARQFRVMRCAVVTHPSRPTIASGVSQELQQFELLLMHEVRSRLTLGLSGAGPRTQKYKQEAPSRVRSRPLVRHASLAHQSRNMGTTAIHAK